jgi:hypothetical protein
MPDQMSMFPTYKGLRTMAKGPVTTSGPERSARVREITPICLTAQIRSASPANARRGPHFTTLSVGGGLTRRSVTAKGTGSQVRWRNSQRPTSMVIARLLIGESMVIGEL